jgi:hypothetical protein
MGYRVTFADVCDRCKKSAFAFITDPDAASVYPIVFAFCPACPHRYPGHIAAYINANMDLSLIEAAWPGFTEKLAMDLVREGT